jgi:hypothetical protein
VTGLFVSTAVNNSNYIFTDILCEIFSEIFSKIVDLEKRLDWGWNIDRPAYERTSVLHVKTPTPS